jgi:hypothetical protein
MNDPFWTLGTLALLFAAWLVFAGLFLLFVKGGTDREYRPGDKPEDWWR